MAFTVPLSDRFIPYVATAAQTTFAYNFPIFNDSDLAVYQISAGVTSLLVLSTDYTVTDAGVAGGGNVVLNVGATADDNIIISGDLPEERTTNFDAAGDFSKDSVNAQFNSLVQLTQQLRRDVDRSVHLDPADIREDATTTFVLPLLDDRKEQYLFFDENGDVSVDQAPGISGPTTSAVNEVVLFDADDGRTIKRPSSEYMIIPQGTTAQRGAPANIVMRGNTTGTDTVEAFVNAGWVDILSSSSGAPITSTYITQTSDGILTNEQAMSDLATGIVKSTTATGVQSIAVDGTDYISPTLASNVDVNGKSFVSLANGDITFAPNGTGDTVITSPILFTPQVSPAYAEGKLYYSSLNKTISLYNSEPDIELQVGQENWIRVYNDSGATILNGAVVYASGKEDVEDRLTVALAQADAEVTSRVIGTATHDILNNAFGFITQFGYVGDVDTSAFADGDTIFLSATVAGGLVNIAPTSPNVSVFLGYVVDSDVTGNLFMTTIANTSGVGVAGDATQLVESARKDSVGTINAGEVVYTAGYNAGQDVVTVELAQSNSSATMAGLGVASGTITNVLTGQLVSSGRVSGFDTSAFAVGDDLYVSPTVAGALTNVKPTGTNMIQKMGIVLRSHGTLGVIVVIGAGRSNDVPNFSAADKMWYGGATGTTAEADITAFGRSLIDDATAAAGATTLGLGTGDAVEFAQLDIDNININGNTISSTDVNGDITVTPNGTGDIVLDSQKWPQADGTPDQVLKTDGAGQLSWGAGGGGGTGAWIELSSTVAASSASISFVSFSTAYRLYKIIYSDIIPSVNGSDFQLTVSTNAGVSYISTGYDFFSTRVVGTNATQSLSNATVATAISLSGLAIPANRPGADVGESAAGEMTFCHEDYDFFVTSELFCASEHGARAARTSVIGGAGVTTNGVDGIKLAFDVGNIASGTITLYGLI